MTPRLPAELLAEILTLAQEGQTPLGRQSTRFAFERVCRDWYLAQDHWAEVCVKGAGPIERLAKLLAEPNRRGSGLVGTRVKSICVVLIKHDARKTGSKVATKLVTLLKLVTEVVSVELEIGHQGLRRNDFLGKSVCKALSKLENLKHFTIAPVSEGVGARKSLPTDSLSG